MKFTWSKLEELSNTFGESFYLLDSQRFESNYTEFLKTFRDIYPNTFIAYSYKTNYTPKLCTIINRKGGYAEVVSEMEFDLAIEIGVSPQKIIFNGPYKNEKSIKKCILKQGIVNLDSFYEIDIVEKIAHDNPEITLSVGIRCNFDVGDPETSRFGFDIESKEFYNAFNHLKEIDNISIKGLHCHFPNRNIESYIIRVDKMLQLSNHLFDLPPEFIDIGGSFFGKMDELLKKQFKCKSPNYQEYAEAIATKFQNFYQKMEASHKPKLILEPGTALAADAMKFVVKVINIKTVRNKNIATVSGSKFNIIPTSNNINLPINIFHDNKKDCCCTEYDSIDIAGYTCIESDYLYKGYRGSLKIGDYIMFDNVGSYSVVMKPPFIFPNCAIIEYNPKNKTYETIKRKEEIDDIFRTYKFYEA